MGVGREVEGVEVVRSSATVLGGPTLGVSIAPTSDVDMDSEFPEEVDRDGLTKPVRNLEQEATRIIGVGGLRRW